MSALVPLLIALPLAGFLSISLLRPSPRLAGYVATGAVAASFLVALVAWLSLLGRPAGARDVSVLLWSWIHAGGLRADFQLLYDPLSATMALIVTGIGTLIHLYSTEYMAGDAGYRRYFAFLNLFIAEMLVLVLAANYLLVLVGWAGVGLSSYLLIGHWRDRPGGPGAAMKAFVVNTLGDIGLMLALFLMWTRLGAVDFERVLGAENVSSGAALAISLCLLLAAAAKSAQLPLQVWLPDAMAGPTPVSALIHAATMVTAGVYLMARSAPILSRSPGAMAAVATIGALTALVAALAATSQTNIKRVLAYSTISQLGYMFLGVGVGAYGAGMFHLYTHALYKACLFLGAGVVIHALHGEEMLRSMGGLRRRLLLTWAAMLAGAAALSAVPPFAGFWSKDEVLTAAFSAPRGSWLLGGMGLLTGGITGYYAFRMLLLAFHGEARGHGDLHRPSALLTWPVGVLGVLSLVGGLPPVGSALATFLDPVWRNASPFHPEVGNSTYVTVSAAAAVLALLGAGLACLQYVRQRLPIEAHGAGRFFLEGLGFDRLYGAFIVGPARSAGRFLSGVFEPGVVDRTVLGAGRLAREAGTSLSEFQSGYVRSYALGVLAGVAVLLAYILWVVA
ncbi:MAG: NADH-quinone oxidoreductase subunit L [Chloroflexota bacterium]|nr:NADH-quinone oxidoreductase subunit L [Chloroflexota bacterium]